MLCLFYFPVLQVEHFNTLCTSEYLLYSVFLFRTNTFYVSGKFSNSINSYVQECIPIGCVPPARDRTLGGVSLNRDPLDRDPHGKRAPQTETPILDRDPPPLDSDLPGQRPPGQRPISWTETPLPHTGVKTLPCRNFVAGGKNEQSYVQHKTQTNIHSVEMYSI